MSNLEENFSSKVSKTLEQLVESLITDNDVDLFLAVTQLLYGPSFEKREYDQFVENLRIYDKKRYRTLINAAKYIKGIKNFKFSVEENVAIDSIFSKGAFMLLSKASIFNQY